MFERFTADARSAVTAARDIAYESNSSVITTAHLLGAVSRVQGLGGRVLAELDKPSELVMQHIQRLYGGGDAPAGNAPEEMPFTNGAKKSLEMALREALSLGHNYIDSEHLLLGLVRMADSASDWDEIRHGATVAQLLEDLKIDAEQTRNLVIEHLSGRRKRTEDGEAHDASGDRVFVFPTTVVRPGHGRQHIDNLVLKIGDALADDAPDSAREALTELERLARTSQEGSR